MIPRATTQLLFRSPRTEFFESVEFSSEHGLDMAGCLTVTLAKKL